MSRKESSGVRSAGIAEQVQLKQVNLLYTQAAGGLTVNLIVSYLLCLMLWDVMPHGRLIAWLAVGVFVALARFALGVAYHRRPNRLDVQRWRNWFIVGSTANGILWGIAGTLLFPVGSAVHQLFLIIILSGMAGGAVVFLSPVLLAYSLYVIPTLFPASVMILLQGSPVYISTGVAGFVFLGGILFAAYRTHVLVRDSLRLGFEKESLVDTLSLAKEKLEVSNRNYQKEIQDRRTAEQALQEALTRFQAVIENTPAVAIQGFNVDGEIRHWNPACEQLFGFSASEARGKRIQNLLLSGVARQKFENILEEICTTKSPQTPREWRVDLRNGGHRWVYSTMFPILSGKRVVEIFCMDVDITERKGVEEKLREHRERLEELVQQRTAELVEVNARLNEEVIEQKRMEQALYEEKERAEVTLASIGDAVITTDARGIVQYLNPVAESLTGWSIGEAQGRSLGTVLHVLDEQSRDPAPSALEQCLEKGTVVGLPERSLLISRSGEEVGIKESAAPIRNRDGEIWGVVIVCKDVSEERRIVQEMSYLAKHDALTGLVNRREFEQRLEHVVASSKAYGGRHALGYLDLDQFKIVNDTAGHAAGDEMLKQVAGLLKSAVRERDALARLGGDEFGLLLDNCPLDKALQIADVLVANLKDFRFTWKGRIFQIGVSIGLVPITKHTEGTEQLLSQADVACYTAKDLGRNQVYVYQAEDSERNPRHSEILRAAELRDALEQDRFRLYYQPIVPLSPNSDQPVHYELLLRLLDSAGELIMPGAFIPAAERYGLMAEIDRWVIRMAFRRAFPLVADAPGAYVAINLSGNSLNDDRLTRFVHQALSDSQVAPEQICFEITETAAIQNLNKATRFVTAMKKKGCRFALDDFGSGLSSFTYLKKLPVDYLKIAGSFVPDMVRDRVDCAMVTAISDVGRIMGITTIAEHADTRAVVEKLREVGVAYAQGDVFGSPQPLNLAATVDCSAEKEAD